jgi:Peptidase family M28
VQNVQNALGIKVCCRSGVVSRFFRKENALRFLVGTLVLAAGLFAQRGNPPADPVRTVVGRLDLVRYKAHIKGLSQFGDRMQGTERNRDAIAWLDRQLASFGYTNVQRHRYMSAGGPLENVYATKIGATTPGEVYIVSAHMDGRGGGEAADDDGSGCAGAAPEHGSRTEMARRHPA